MMTNSHRNHSARELPIIEGTGMMSDEAYLKLEAVHSLRVNHLANSEDHGYPLKVLHQAVKEQLKKRTDQAARESEGTYGRELLARLRFEKNPRPYLDLEIAKKCFLKTSLDAAEAMEEDSSTATRVKVTKFDDPRPTFPERFVIIHSKLAIGSYVTALQNVVVQNRQSGVLMLDPNRQGVELVESFKKLSIKDTLKAAHYPDDVLDDDENIVREFLLEQSTVPYFFGQVLPVSETVYSAHTELTNR